MSSPSPPDELFSAVFTWMVVGPAKVTYSVLVARMVAIVMRNDYIALPVLTPHK